MKTTSFKLILLLISFSCICGMCSKEDAPVNNPPGELTHSRGFLATMAPRSSGQSDTVCIRHWTLTSLSESGINGGFVERPRDVWQVANDGSGHWYFKNNEGDYLSIGEPRIGGYQKASSTQISERTKFIINKDEKNRFYIESAFHRGYYLVSEVGGAPPKHDFIDFTTAKQLWFIRP